MMTIICGYTDDALRQRILEACKRASDRLTGLWGLEVAINLASRIDFERADSWSSDDESFDWRGENFFDCDRFFTAQLSLKTGRVLCGITKLEYWKQELPHRLTIDTIEGSPIDDHPMKGKVLRAFCEAALEIAKELNLPEIDGNDPIDSLLTAYKKIGFEILPPVDGVNMMRFPVTQNSALDL